MSNKNIKKIKMNRGLQKANTLKALELLKDQLRQMAECPSNKIRKIRIAAAKAKEEEWKNFCTAYIQPYVEGSEELKTAVDLIFTNIVDHCMECEYLYLKLRNQQSVWVGISRGEHFRPLPFWPEFVTGDALDMVNRFIQESLKNIRTEILNQDSELQVQCTGPNIYKISWENIK